LFEVKNPIKMAINDGRLNSQERMFWRFLEENDFSNYISTLDMTSSIAKK